MKYDEDYLNEQFAKLLDKFDEHVIKFSAQINLADNAFIDNPTFLKLMGVSQKTAQSWRDQGIISFSQIGSKIFYRKSDIIDMLNKYHIESSNL